MWGLCARVVITTQELGAQVVVAQGLSVHVIVAMHGDQPCRGGHAGAVWLHPRCHAGCWGPCGGCKGCGYVLVASCVGTLGRVLVTQGCCAHIVVKWGLRPMLLLGMGLVAMSLLCGGSVEPVCDCDEVGCVPMSLSLSSLCRAQGPGSHCVLRRLDVSGV